MVFVAFTQHYVQSADLMSKGSKVFSVYRASHPPKREGYLKSLPSCGFSGSLVSLRRQLCSLSGTCQTKRVIAGKMHSQSPNF